MRPDTFVERNFVVLAALVLAAAAVLRFSHLGYDLPSWVSPDYFTDEGWWADAARGKVFFDSYFSDDFGTALLVTPAYTGLLELVYRVFGVGTVQTRALAAGAGVLTVVVVGAFLLARCGRPAALLGSVLLAFSPLAWAHGRVGLIESTQELFVVGAFALWFAPRRRAAAAFSAGALSALAVWLKPNALMLGTLPLLLAAATGLALGRRSAPGAFPAALRAVLWAAGGFLACCGAALLVIGPYWDAFVKMVVAETHGETYTLWSYLKAPGLAFLSAETVGEKSVPGFWQAAVWSPALAAACWIAVLRRFFRPADETEVSVLVWLAATLAVLSLEPEQPSRRLMALLPPMAVFAALILTRSAPPPEPRESGPGPARSYLFWFVLTLPLLIAVKPFPVAAIMAQSGSFPMGEHLGFSTAAAGAAVTLGWLVLLAGLAPWGRAGERLARVVAGRGVFAVPVLLVLLEVPVVVGGTWGTPRTFLDTQAELGRSVPAGATVMGHAATSLLLPYAVQTLRRTTPQDHSPPPNPDVWERTRPQYILDWRTYNYGAVPRRYGDLITAHGYTFEKAFPLGPYRGGQPRFLLELYRLPSPGGGR